MTRKGFWEALFGGIVAATSTDGAKMTSNGCPYRPPTLAEIKSLNPYSYDNGYTINGHIFRWSCFDYVINGWCRVKQGNLGVWPRNGGNCPFIEMTHRESEDVYSEEEFMQDCFRLCVKKMQRLGIEL